MRAVLIRQANGRVEVEGREAFAAAHGVRPRVNRVPLQDAGKALTGMENGHISGRTVVVMS